MIKGRERNAFCSIVLAMALSLSAGLVAGGCNTEQSPRAQVTDAQITTQVKAKLAQDVNATTLTNIDVNTTNGVVTLSGQVESAEVKSKADAIASSVPGVVRVNNSLQVNSAAAPVTH
jgi:hyperosmotically inducible periplasmic protein